MLNRPIRPAHGNSHWNLKRQSQVHNGRRNLHRGPGNLGDIQAPYQVLSKNCDEIVGILVGVLEFRAKELHICIFGNRPSSLIGDSFET